MLLGAGTAARTSPPINHSPFVRLSSPTFAGPSEVRNGIALGFEDALGLARALGTLGGPYAPVALQLLKVCGWQAHRGVWVGWQACGGGTLAGRGAGMCAAGWARMQGSGQWWENRKADPATKDWTQWLPGVLVTVAATAGFTLPYTPPYLPTQSPTFPPSLPPSPLQDLTITVAHPQYCAASLAAASRPSFARRLAKLWQQLTTPAERCGRCWLSGVLAL